MRAELVVRISLAAAAVRLLAASGWRLAAGGWRVAGTKRRSYSSALGSRATDRHLLQLYSSTHCNVSFASFMDMNGPN